MRFDAGRAAIGLACAVLFFLKAPGVAAAEPLTSTKLKGPVTFHGLLPQRANVVLVLAADGSYRLTLKIIPLRPRPTGEATETGHWQIDSAQSRILLVPEKPKGAVRTANMVNGEPRAAQLSLNGFFPPGTTVTVTQ